MKHACSITVRPYECDSYAHVNNAVYMNYLEHARHEYMKALGLDRNGMQEAGYGVWVAKISIRYATPAFADDELEIVTEPVKKGRMSGVLRQTVTRGGETVAEAEVTWASVDAKGRPAPLPPEFDPSGLAP